MAIGLLLLGVASLVPLPGAAVHRESAPQNQTAQSVLNQTEGRPPMDNSSCPPEPVWVPPCFYKTPILNSTQSAGVPGGQAVSANVAAMSTSSSLGNASAAAAAGATGATAEQLPESFLAALPGEGIGALLATISPLIFGFLVAALIYAAYSRRQDSP